MLEGLKVVEMATYIAGPGAGGMLADWGADVIKVEPPGGCAMRGFFASMPHIKDEGNPVFEIDNRGKRSIAIDVSQPEGAEVVRKLLAEADVFLTNVRPAALTRAKLDWDSLHADFPKLIYASITGYGLEGEDRDRPGFDVAAFWSRSGLARLTAPKGDAPFPIRMAVGDHTTSMALTTGILAALYERNVSGKGRLVETSLLRTGIYSMATDMSIQLRLGRVASTKQQTEAVDPFTSFYKTSDDEWIALLVRQGPRGADGLFKALDQPDLAEDDKYSFIGRRKNNVEVAAKLNELFALKTMAEWGKLLDEHDVVWAPVQTPAQVTQDPQAHAAGAFVDIDLPDGRVVKSVAPPVRFHGDETTHFPVTPELSEQADEILAELGYSREKAAELKKSGAVI